MKNLSVSVKLTICLLSMILLALVISGLGLFGMGVLSRATDTLYEVGVRAVEYVGHFRENFQEQRVLVQELTLVEGDRAKTQAVVDRIEDNKEEMLIYLSGFKSDILGSPTLVSKPEFTEENSRQFARLEEIYNGSFVPDMDAIVATAGGVDTQQIAAFITADYADEMNGIMEYAFGASADLSQWSAEAAGGLYRTLRTIVIIVTAVAFCVSTFFSIYLPSVIALPLRHLVKVADAVAEGDMDEKVIYDDRRDEVGMLATAFERMKTEINAQITVVESLADADLRVEPHPRGPKDTLGHALVKLASNMDGIISDVGAASVSVAQGAGQVASQSSALAQGTTEQAASVEQLSSAFFEISLNTKESAGLAGKAADLAEQVKTMAIEGEAMMGHMIQSARDADAATQSIDKIIKVIEEISFQTNLLALNAAVEAAHAGQNGSGFAVVAAEVRSLASKSSASSKETSDLIADTIEKVQMGAEIARQTSESFKQIVGGVIESTKLIADIAKSSEEQALAIEQINTGITQVAQVIHTNSGAAEECAAAAERMSGQARTLEDSVSRFKTRDGRGRAGASETPEARPTRRGPDFTIDLSPTIPSDDFGKY